MINQSSKPIRCATVNFTGPVVACRRRDFLLIGHSSKTFSRKGQRRYDDGRRGPKDSRRQTEASRPDQLGRERSAGQSPADIRSVPGYRHCRKSCASRGASKGQGIPCHDLRRKVISNLRCTSQISITLIVVFKVEFVVCWRRDGRGHPGD